MQYTIRDIPKAVDQALRRRAKQQGKSLNQVTVDALKQAMGSAEQPARHHDLDFIVGTWVEDKKFDQVVADHDRVNPDDWR